MRTGIATEETWSFLHEIHDDLKTHHQVSLFQQPTVNPPFFKERINRYLFRRAWQTFMQLNDVIFFEWASYLLAEASHLPKTCGIVTRLHRYEMYQWVDRINWENVDKIILVSKAKQQEFIEKFPDQAAKTTVIYEAVDPDHFAFAPKPFTGDLGILCHLTPRKRVYELILAFYDLGSQRNGLRLHIGGGPHPAFGDYYFALQDLTHRLNLQNQVIFHGPVKNAADWYNRIDIFISNAYSEGLQVSPLEAMACGRLCLAHRWAGADEMLPEPYLYYSDRELQEAIGRLCNLTDAARQEAQTQMRRLVLDKFNVHQTKVQIRRLIEQATRK